jgi:hypothetical protein
VNESERCCLKYLVVGIIPQLQGDASGSSP